MSGLGLRIRTPNRNTRTQERSQAEQVALGAELVAHEPDAHEPVRSDSGTSEDARLKQAAHHRFLLEESAVDPSKFVGLPAEEVSPPNPFIRFGSPEVHMVSPLSYHTLTPNQVNTSVSPIRFGSKRKRRPIYKRKGSRKLNLTKILSKLINSRKKGKNINLVKLINRTLKKQRK